MDKKLTRRDKTYNPLFQSIRYEARSARLYLFPENRRAKIGSTLTVPVSDSFLGSQDGSGGESSSGVTWLTFWAVGCSRAGTQGRGGGRVSPLIPSPFYDYNGGLLGSVGVLRLGLCTVQLDGF